MRFESLKHSLCAVRPLQLINLASPASVRFWCSMAADSDSVVVYEASWEVLAPLRDC